MPPKGRRRGAGRSRSKNENASDIEEELPPPPPPRPFKEVEGLPLSIEEPSYNILNNALSLKDSAVLYSSLMRSRKSYTNGNIFDLYWAKGKTKFDNDVNARDRMNKFCDCAMTLGPHNFDVRFFILKDEEVEKKRQDEKEKKKEKRLAAKKMREEKQKIRELKNKAKQEGLDPSTVVPPTQVSADQQTDKTESASTPQNTEAKEDEEEDEEDEESDENDSDKENESRETSAQPVSKDNTEPPSETQSKPEVPTEQPSQDATPSQEASGSTTTPQPPKEQTPNISTPQTEIQNRPLPPLQVQNHQTQTASPQPQAPSASNASPTQNPPPQQPNQSAPQPIQPQQPPPQNDMMQTPESQMMIANLNVIARAEPALNTLMKIVATGNAKPEQIREFQGYIQRAKAMGPTSYYRQPPFISNSQPVSQPTPPAPKPLKKPKAPKKPKPPKEKQLTTFQEMYVDGADLVFEFSENANIRYHLPKDSIIERLENGDILVSFLVIHNRDQIKRWKNRQEAKKAKKEKKDQEEEGVGSGEAKIEEVKEEPTEEKVEKRTRRTRKSSEKEAEEKEIEEKELAIKEEKEKKQKEMEEKEQKEKEAKELLEDQEPITYFSAMSFTLTNISKRFLTIFYNSFNEPDDVKSRMEKILKEGIRVPKHYLWYSVDAYEDEELAESLREALYLIENPPKGKNRKRALEENPLIGNATAKKIKKET